MRTCAGPAWPRLPRSAESLDAVGAAFPFGFPQLAAAQLAGPLRANRREGRPLRLRTADRARTGATLCVGGVDLRQGHRARDAGDVCDRRSEGLGSQRSGQGAGWRVATVGALDSDLE